MWNSSACRFTASNQYQSNVRASSVTCEEEDSGVEGGGAYTTSYRNGSISAEEEAGAVFENYAEVQHQQQVAKIPSSLINTVGLNKPAVHTPNPSSSKPITVTPPPTTTLLKEEKEADIVTTDLSFTYENMFKYRGIDLENFQNQQRAINRLRSTAPLTPSLSKDKSYQLAVVGAEMWQRMVVSYMQFDANLARTCPPGSEVPKPFFVNSPTEWNAFLTSERNALIAENEVESQGDDGVGPMKLRGRSSTAQPLKKKVPPPAHSKFDVTSDTRAYPNFKSSQGNSLFSVCFRAFAATLHGFSELFLPFIACAYLDRLAANHHKSATLGGAVGIPDERFVIPTSNAATKSSVPAPRVSTDQILRLAVVLLSLSGKVHTDLYVSLSYFCKYVNGVGASYTPAELAQVELRVLRGLNYNCSVAPTHLKDLLAVYLTDDERAYVSEALSWKV